MTVGDVQAREALPTRRSLREAAARQQAAGGEASKPAEVAPDVQPAQPVARRAAAQPGHADAVQSGPLGDFSQLARAGRPAIDDEFSVAPEPLSPARDVASRGAAAVAGDAHAPERRAADRQVPTTTGERAALDLELMSLERLAKMRAEGESAPTNRAGRRNLSREARARVREHSMPRSQGGSRTWIPRAAVVAALAAATIAVPATGSLGALQGEGLTKLVAEADPTAEIAAGTDSAASYGGQSTYTIVQQAVAQPSTPPALAQLLSSNDRRAALASRSEMRSSLPGCDSSAIAPGGNGTLSESDLCELPQGGGYYLQPEAAAAFAEMSDAFETRFGIPLRVTSAYRSYARQSGLYARNPGMTAVAGKSNHGWGYAVDFDKSSYGTSDKWQWLQTNAEYYGFGNPDWAKGSRYEPWHWEYMAGVVRVGNESGTGYGARLAAQEASAAAEGN